MKTKDHMTAEEYYAMIKNQKMNKYHSTPTTVNNIHFPSLKEANRYCDLKLLQQAGEIVGFARQARFPLLGCEYVCDFVVWWKDGRVTVEDTKGKRTDTYIVKIKQFKELFPSIEFVEL